MLYEAILGKSIVSVNEFLNLKEGDILRLDRSANDKAIVTIDKKEVFLAEVGLHRFRKSIRIEELIRSDKDEIKNILEQYEEERRSKLMSTEHEDEYYDDDDILGEDENNE